MFYSQCLLSGKGPLGAIWVAAYCFKRLKKAQVKQTDISFSVDKILQDEINDQTYRVLAYLLLGVVRIYSKKVEYLFHDCNEVLVKIKKFKIDTTKNVRMETLCTSITLPARFELDAFDLDVLEDVGGGNIAPQEEITLKDVRWKNEQTDQFSLVKYQSDEFDCFQSTGSDHEPMVEEPCSVNKSHLMDFNFEITALNNPSNLSVANEKSQECTLSPEEQMKLVTDFVVQRVPTEPVNLFSQDKQIDEEQMTKGASHEDKVQNGTSIEKIRSCRTSQDDIRMFCQDEEELVVPVEPFNESHQPHEEQTSVNETPSSECQMHQETREIHEGRDLQINVVQIQDGQSYQEECIDYGKAFVDEVMLEEHIEGFNEENHSKGKLDIQENVSIEGGKFHVILPESINVGVTPESKFQDASVARKPGATTPEFMLIPTPAAREGAHISRKRRFIFDDLTVLPNMVIKQSLYDTKDLVSKRRKFTDTLKAWRASRISRLPEGFHDSLLPCHSLELQSLFSKKKMKISESFGTSETPGKLDESESLFSRKKMKISESFGTSETPGKLDESESQAFGMPDHMATAPETPPRLSAIRSVESPDDVTPSSPHDSREREQLLRNDELNLMKECNEETINLEEAIEREQCLRKDEEYNLVNEDSKSSETENSKSSAWTRQTRKIAMHLHRSFLSQRKQREEAVVNFSQVFRAKTRKQCARLFYEILVLKTTSFVDVNQNDAYGDISVKNLPKLDQTFGVSRTQKMSQVI